MASTIERDSALDTEASDDTSSEATRRSRRPIILAVVGLLGLALLVWGVAKWRFARTHQSTDNAQVDGHIVPVISRVGGYVSSVSVRENDQVKEGTPLVQLDAAELRVRLAQAEADVAAARATAGGGGGDGQAQAALEGASGQRGVLTAQIEAARSTAEKTAADLVRMTELASKQIISAAQLDAARSAAQTAQANLTALQRQNATAGASVSGAQAGVRLAQARLLAAQAARDNAALQLSYATITAPASGVVSRKTVEVGQLVQPAQPLMFVVADSGAWVAANFKETQLAHMKVGQKVDFDVDAYGGCHAEGRVESLSPATGAKFALLPPENATGNFTKVVQRVPVRIAIVRDCGGGRPLRPGMSVVVHVNTAG